MVDETVETEIIEAEIREAEEKIRFRRYAKIFSVLVILVLAITITIATITENKEASELEAWNKIFTATFTSQTSAEDNLSADLETILKDGANETDAGFYAQMLILEHSGVTYEKAQLEAARTAGSAFISKYPESKFVNQVKLDLGTVLYNLEDYQGALKLYTEVASSKSKYLLGEASLFKGITQEKLGKDQEAIQTYTAITAGKNNFLGNIKEFASFAKAQLEEKKN